MISRLCLLALAGVALSGCASLASGPAHAPDQPYRQCISNTTPVRYFTVHGPAAVEIAYSANRRYLVELAGPCPALAQARWVSLASGPERLLGQARGQPVWGAPVRGAICGGVDSRLLLSDGFGYSSWPRPSCRIARTWRLP